MLWNASCVKYKSIISTCQSISYHFRYCKALLVTNHDSCKQLIT